MKSKLSLGRKVLVVLFAVMALFSLIAGICLPKLTKSAGAAEGETVTDYSDQPQYNYLRVDHVSYTVDTGDTPDTLKKDYFKVYGKENEGDAFAATAIDPEMLEVTIVGDGYLHENQHNTVTITYLPTSVSAEYTIENVAVASVQSVTVKVADEWQMSGGYYRQTVNAENPDASYEFSAFVSTMTQEQVFSHLVVTVNYAKSSHDVAFTYADGRINGTSTNDKISLADTTSSFYAGSQEIMVAFGSSAAEKGTISLNFEEEKIVAIELADWTQPEGICRTATCTSWGLI